MAVRHQQYRSRGSYINHYHFEKAGDTIPIHTHDVDHDAMIIKGRAKVVTPHYGEAELPIGKIMTLHAPHPHGFTALEDDTHMINTFDDPEKHK